MKKILITAALLLLIWPATAQAAAVTAALPTFAVTINGVETDNATSQYPFLVYNEITYVPMTYADANLLGLATQWSADGGLMVNKVDFFDPAAARAGYVGYPGDSANAATQQAAIAQFAIRVGSQSIDNQTEEYPLLIFRDITYFPLTWRFAVEEFGWQYTFDAVKGLVITPPDDRPAQPVVSSTLPDLVKVTGNVVNIRSTASTDAQVVTQVKEGDTLSVLAVQGEWYQVAAGGETGWIAGWLVEKAGQDAVGVRNSLTAGVIMDQGRSSSVTLQLGAGNEAALLSAKAGELILLASNNTCERFQPLSGTGLLQSITAQPAGSGARLTISTAPEAICAVRQTDGVMTVTAKLRTNDAPGLTGKIIVLDPGHGNLKENGIVDPGATGTVLGITDREVAEGLTAKLKPLLEAQGATVYLTRDLSAAPRAMTLAERAALAEQVKADVFLSLHGNALEGNTVKNGIEVYYWGREHITPQIQCTTRKALAQSISSALGQSTGRSCVVKEENFAVLRENTCPSVLIEAGYLSNAQEEALLASDAYQTTLAQGILNGLQAYLQ